MGRTTTSAPPYRPTVIDGFRGRLITADDPEYHDLRRVWNHAVDRRPAVLARCADTADAGHAIRYARERGLPLTVRAGGHNFAGLSVADGGVVIDVRDLTGITVDARRRVARIQAGLRWGAVDRALQRHGLVTTGGSVSKVGVSGFTLGTGLGFLGRLHGLAGDNVLGATVVTADGTVIEVDSASHPDLYWALRGGGGGFGVVTEWRMRLHPLTTPVAGPLIYPIEKAVGVLHRVLEITADAPATFNWAAVLTTAPPDPALPDLLRGRPALLLPIFTVTPDDPVLAELRRATHPAVDLAAPVPFCTFQTSTDAAAPDGTCWDVRSEWLTTLDGAAIDDVAAMIQRAGSPLSELLLRPLGGAIARPGTEETPFSYRSASLLLEVIAHWDEGDGATERAWMTESWARLRRLSAGGPDVNHLGLDEPPERARAAYRPPALERLAAVRAAYDPDGVFPSPLRDVTTDDRRSC